MLHKLQKAQVIKTKKNIFIVVDDIKAQSQSIYFCKYESEGIGTYSFKIFRQNNT